jgi:putative ABC transport system substrate-binding protein
MEEADISPSRADSRFDPQRTAARSKSCTSQALTWSPLGFLNHGSPEPNAKFVAAFREGLGEIGYVEGQSVTIEYRWGQFNNERLPELAADLVRRKVSVIATPGSTPAALAAKAATTTIPIVFDIGGDPVQLGLVSNFNRPGGNITGVSHLNFQLVGKQLGWLHELLPTATRLPRAPVRSYRSGSHRLLFGT